MRIPEGIYDEGVGRRDASKDKAEDKMWSQGQKEGNSYV